MCYIKVETDNHPTDYSINKLIIKKRKNRLQKSDKKGNEFYKDNCKYTLSSIIINMDNLSYTPTQLYPKGVPGRPTHTPKHIL